MHQATWLHEPLMAMRRLAGARGEGSKALEEVCLIAETINSPDVAMATGKA